MNKNRLTMMALVVICLSVALVSCDKDEDPAPAPTDSAKTILLTKAAWKVKATGIDADKNGTIDGFPLIVKACALDNTYTFNKAGTGVVDEDATKCDALDPQTSSFGWVFKSEETVINADFKIAGWSGDATIAALTDTSCILYKDTVTIFGTARAIVSLKH